MTFIILKTDDFTTYFMGFMAFITALVVLFYALYMLISAFGVLLGFEKKVLKRPTEHNKILAYQCMGTHMVFSEREELGAQMGYLIAYLNRIFPKYKFNRKDLMWAYQKIPFSDQIPRWAGKHFSETEKLILIEFLIDLAFHNHHFSRRELGLLHHISKLAGVERSDVQSLLRLRFEQKKRMDDSNRERNQRETSFRKKDERVRSLQILGLPASTRNWEDVRKAYRSLARKHHPDRFAKASAEELRLAHERFTEISVAHDQLKELMA